MTNEIYLPYTVDELSKDQLQELGHEIAKTGEDTPATTLKRIKKLREILDTAWSLLEKAAISEVDENHLDGFQLRSGGPIYDYSADSVYADLTEQVKRRKGELDRRMKSKEENEFDSEGALIEKVKIRGYRKDSIIIKI